MISKWDHLGHSLGECWLDHTKTTSYVHIPKNASSYVKGCLTESGKWSYRAWVPPSTVIEKYVIILRDPIVRWISGYAQYCKNCKSVNLDINQVTDQVTFDDHTEKQTYFLDGVDLDKAIFFRADGTLRDTFSKWFAESGYGSSPVTMARINDSHLDYRHDIKKLLEKMLTSDHYDKLTAFFQDDYNLIKSIDNDNRWYK